jgi:Fe-S cluster biogenesis protein NfuA
VNPELSKVVDVCARLLAPLVEADGGDLFVVAANQDEVHLHVTGTYAGCPGVPFAADHVFLPVLRTVLPRAKLTVTSGWKAPEGAVRATSKTSF